MKGAVAAVAAVAVGVGVADGVEGSSGQEE